MRLVYLLPLLLLAAPASYAQSDLTCGTVVDAALLQAREALDEAATRYVPPAQRNPTLVPVTLHIARRTNGTGGLTVAQWTAALNTMNNIYAPTNLQFFQCGPIDYIDDDNYYDYNSSQEAALRAATLVPNTVNIYTFNSVTSSGSGNSLCGYAYFPGSHDVVVMANGCFTNGSTLSHELGHYYALYHTHQVSNNVQELVNGSNCTFAGDRLCDTPADPQLSSSTVNSACVYTGNATDPNGDPYAPDATNLMSYSRKSCRNFFSPGQLQKIQATAATQRNYLNCVSVTADFDSPQTIAAGCDAQIDFNYTGYGATSYAWDVDGDGVTDYTTANPTHTYSVPGNYDVALTASNGTSSITEMKANWVLRLGTQTGGASEDFETGNSLPTVITNGPDWDLYSSGTFCQGSQSLRIDNYNNQVPGAKSYLLADELVVPANGAQLSFQLAYAPYSATYYDGLRVEVSTDCGATYQSVYFKENLALSTTGGYQSSGFSPGSCNDWRTETVDLTPFAGQTILLRMANINGYGNYLYLDNWTVSGAALPVELTRWTGRVEATHNTLVWTTATERNADYFEVQRRDEAGDYATVGRVGAVGDSDTEQRYRYLDRRLPAALHYYRLRQVDRDGTEDYSATIALDNRRPAARWQVFPNPVTDELTIRADGEVEAGTYRLFSATGARVAEGVLHAQRTQLRTADLPAGIYLLRVQSQGTTKELRVVKQ